MGLDCATFKTDTTTTINIYLALSSMMMNYEMYLISDFRRAIAENCALLSYYTASSGNFLKTILDNLSVPSSRV
jgi:hypothetical protein